MQQSGVIGILQILEHQLPIAWNKLPRIAKNLELATIENSIHKSVNRLAKKIFVQLRVMVEGRKDRAVVIVHLKDIEPVFFAFEIVGHAALLFNPAPKRNPDQVSL